MARNRQRVLLSDLSGRGNVTYKLKQHGLADRLDPEARGELLSRIKQMEYQGYDFEAAEGTFELLVREAANPAFHPFDVVSYEINTKYASGNETVKTASVVLRVEGDPQSATAIGQGPVHALDVCLRQRLASRYPAISDVRLVDYKVRVLGVKGGTESKVRLLVAFGAKRSWATVGISDNVIAASWHALVDALGLRSIPAAREKRGAE